jgi:hypothetical protein
MSLTGKSHLVIALSLSACGVFQSQEPPSGAAHISGVITAVQKTRIEGNPIPDPNVLVEEFPDEVDEGDKAYVAFTEASIFVGRPGQWRRGGPDDLVVGGRVNVWFKGITIDTYPQLGSAENIALIVQ